MKPIIVTIFLITAGWKAYSQSHTITLERSREAALAYSNAIKNGELRVLSSKADIAAAKSDYLPSVSGIGLGIYGFKDFIGAQPPLLEKGINNVYTLSLTAIQPIYTGGKILTGNKLASLQMEVSKILASQSKDSVLLATEQKYWNLVNLQEQGKTILANEVFLNSVLKQQQDMLASGLIARNDLLKVKVQLSRLRLNKSKVANGRKLAVLDFCLFSGIPYDSLLAMKDTLNLEQRLSMPESGPDTSLTSNKNYHLLTKNMEAEKLQTMLTRSDNLPSVSAGIGASKTGVVNGPTGSSTMPVALGIVKIPISDGLWGRGRQKMKKRRISEEVAQNNFQDGQRQLKVGIMKSWYDLEDALSEISFARDNMRQANENLRVNQDNYKAGLSSISDLLDAQAEYQEAASDLTNAYAGFYSKKAAYNYNTGNISL